MQKRNTPMLISTDRKTTSLRDAVSASWLADENQHVKMLLKSYPLDQARRGQVQVRAIGLVEQVRSSAENAGLMEAFMRQYDLSSEEGIILMCLAEALLRIPDNDTAEKLIADKLSDANWEAHLGKSSSVLVNASTWGLMLTGKLVSLSEDAKNDFSRVLGKLAQKSGEPLVRMAVRQAMKIMGHQYVMGRDINEAMDRADKKTNRRYRHSYDMLGEAALTAADAAGYFEAYREGIIAIGKRNQNSDVFSAASISVKLSALHPRYEFGQYERVMAELPAKLLQLAQLARANGIALTIDAEEADRQLLQLDIFTQVYTDASLQGWDGLGMVVQAYFKMAPAVIDYLAALATSIGRRIPMRLVKGAYWDAEIKHAQVEGLAGYPVFTRKANTDVSYGVCAQKLLQARAAFYPQFATHNAQTIATISELAGERIDYEFQRLHGMGEDLYTAVKAAGMHDACRVYAPVGSHEDLLPYLVRRLLENGANTSFVNRLVDDKLPAQEVVEDPLLKVIAATSITNPHIGLPAAIFGASRLNSIGINLASEPVRAALAASLDKAVATEWQAEPLLGKLSGKKFKAADAVEKWHSVTNPAAHKISVATVRESSREEVDYALSVAAENAVAWEWVAVDERAKCLEKAADLLQQKLPEFMAVCALEAGKTAHDSISEIREAIDFLRYYAVQARAGFSTPLVLSGPTGESNHISLHGRGVFVCISPWNFPLAIFIGQIAAALVTGNTVLAKPAEQTPVIAYKMVELMHQAGIPREALQFLPGDGAKVGSQLTADPRVAGVCFTGSTETARLIARSLLDRDAPLATLIAETGGQNVMLVDSSALAEQVVQDVVASAFLSAGQRCSALRVLYLQDDVADRILEMLKGAMAEIKIDDPALLATDVGPVIDQDALNILQAHALKMDQQAKLIARVAMPAGLEDGTYFAPVAYEISGIEVLEREVFGPVLHVVRYRAKDIDKVIDAVNNTGYGLTLGIHSRVDRSVEYISQRIRVGNCYVNRSMIGAVVGVQPFGGEGLSGTGPKAGGPHYLNRFATERVISIDTTASGGNASLLSQGG
ncbi:MAG: bifunctional proline dehydrogenase/L-glutamate gamma-semialdehyde dehydrogenase PutA [Xanthomonadales bacterium]|nr:bifunctional proline dehydrogenase/L-glutamate gamma-semialdehyde dehydrogenase PutA [Xanthomonadales bacterium]